LKIVALSRYPDIEVDIFEAAEKLAEIGAGIGLFSRKWRSAEWTFFLRHAETTLLIYHLDRYLGNYTEAGSGGRTAQVD